MYNGQLNGNFAVIRVELCDKCWLKRQLWKQIPALIMLVDTNAYKCCWQNSHDKPNTASHYSLDKHFLRWLFVWVQVKEESRITFTKNNSERYYLINHDLINTLHLLLCKMFGLIEKKNSKKTRTICYHQRRLFNRWHDIEIWKKKHSCLYL